MTPDPTASPAGKLRGNYVMLRADTLRLLLPQHEVGAAEYLVAGPASANDAGLSQPTASAGKRPLAALSAQMTLLPQCPADRFVVTPLGDAADELGWCWNELRVLIDVELQPQPLPAVLHTPTTPVDQYAEHDGEIAYLCSASRLRAYALASRS
jgi:hypothetical protein